MLQLPALTTAAAALCAAAGTALAQGALRPVEALIVNPPSRPVPVTIVPAAPPATAMCRIDFGTGNPLPATHSSTSFPIADLSCTAGVTRLDVHRVVASSWQFPPEAIAVHFHATVGLGSVNPVMIDRPIATVSSGTPDLALAHPVRIDKSAGVTLLAQNVCSSGISGVPVRCMGTVFLIGTPVN